MNFGEEVSVTARMKDGLRTLSGDGIVCCEYARSSAAYTLADGERAEALSLRERFAGHTATHDFQLMCAGNLPGKEPLLAAVDAAYIVGLEARGLSPNARRVMESSYPKSTYLTQGFKGGAEPWWKLW